MPETVEEVAASSTSAGRAFARAPIEEDIDGTSTDGGSAAIDAIGGRIERRIPDSMKDKLAWMSGGDVEDESETASTETIVEPAAAAAAAAVKPAEPAKPGDATAVVDPAKAAAPAPELEYVSRAERAEAANRALLAEVDGYKKAKPAPAGLDKLVTAADLYIEDPFAAMKHLVAHAFGIDDPNAPEVEAELRDLYTDLTAKELGTSVDAAHQAKRDAARTRKLWDRDKRQRKADEERATTTSDSDEQRIAKTGEYIVGLKDGDKPVLTAEAHPHLFALASDIDGKKPGEVIAMILQREIRTGRIDPKQPDATLAKLAADIAETHYRTIADKAIASRSKTPSTDKPSDAKSPAAAPSARTEQRQSHGTRNLTAADASVAPATPPAQPKPAEKPKFKTRQERIDHSFARLQQPKR